MRPHPIKMPPCLTVYTAYNNVKVSASNLALELSIDSLKVIVQECSPSQSD